MNIGKRRLRSCKAWSLLLAIPCFIVPVQAQQSANEVGEEAIEEIVVTGSRIPRAGFDTLQPAIVIDAQYMEDGGFTDVASALNQVPAFGVPLQSTQGDQNSYSTGQTFVNFFGLGSQRTLTLVNGRRFVSSNSPALFINAEAGLQVDLNMIPSSLVERIETIAVGGAPIYGADAIAGTVNVIMKSDFEGFNIDTSYGVSQEGEMGETKFGVSWGANTADGRGNVSIGIEYTDRDGMIESDMPHLAVGWQFREPADATVEFDRVLVPNAHANIVSNGGIATPEGDFGMLPNFGIGQWDDGSYLSFAPDGSLVPYDVGEPTGNAVWSIGGEGIFLPDLTGLFTPLRRTLGTAFAHYELTDNVEVFGEMWVANTQAEQLVSQPAYQSGFFGEESFALNFPIDHPLLTPAAQTTLAGLTYNGVPATNFWVHRASTDLRPFLRGNGQTSEVNMHRFVGGLRGDFEAANRYWTWDVSYNIGRSIADSISPEISSQRMFYALDVIPDGSGGLGCRVTVDPTSRPVDPGGTFGTSQQPADFNDCVPLDIFGDGRASQDALDYIGVFAIAKTALEQRVIEANIGTDIVELPAGGLGVALGVSTREEKGDFNVSGFSELGLGRSVPVGSLGGKYESDEIYVEFYAPLISEDMDIPFANSMSLEGAWRRMDNSLAGTDEAWTIGGRWAPIPDIEVRGNVTRSVRAPAITELFLPVSGTFSFADDPCDQRYVDSGPDPATRRANCIAGAPGLTPIADPDSFVSRVANASVQGTTGGNTGLSNEVADAWTAGVILRPRWVEGLSLSIDYVDFDIEDAIESFSLEEIMQSCYDQVDFPNVFCGQFTRDATGQLPAVNAFTSGYLNAGQRTFKGYTMEVLYSTDLFAGQLDASASVMNIQEDVTVTGTAIDEDDGEIGQSEWQAQLYFRYSQDKWAAMLQPRFIGKGVWDRNEDVNPTARDIMGEDGVWIFNGSFRYDFNDMIGVQLNINNIFDELPSPGAIASGNDIVYDNIGRFYRLGIQIQL